VFIAIVWAVSIHTVTAFLYVGLGGRPFWNSAIVGRGSWRRRSPPGPALIILALQIIRRVSDYRITDRALLTLRSIVQVSMLINVFLLANEVFKEFYSGNLHVASSKYLTSACTATTRWCVDLDGDRVQPGRNGAAGATGQPEPEMAECHLRPVHRGHLDRERHGLVVPGFIPTPLGEIVEYSPR